MAAPVARGLAIAVGAVGPPLCGSLRSAEIFLMPHAGDFILVSCQATLFTPDAEVSAARFMSRMLPSLAEQFDGEPIILPLPEGVPAEVPKVILQSRTTEWRCEVASGRMNLLWRRVPESRDMRLGQFYETATPLLLDYGRFIDSRIGRLAAVVSRYVPHETPGVYLAGHFCQERWLRAPFNRPEGFELHAHKKFSLSENLRANSWVRSKSAHLAGEQPRPIVFVEQDLNTLGEETDRQFDDDQIRRFFEAASVEFDAILQLYYPVDAE